MVSRPAGEASVVSSRPGHGGSSSVPGQGTVRSASPSCGGLRVSWLSGVEFSLSSFHILDLVWPLGGMQEGLVLVLIYLPGDAGEGAAPQEGWSFCHPSALTVWKASTDEKGHKCQGGLQTGVDGLR
jgi:hypothetical protein